MDVTLNKVFKILEKAIKILCLLLLVAALYPLAGKAYAVANPCRAISSADGSYLYLPDQTTGACRIRVISTATSTEIDSETFYGLIPYGMALSPNGKKLYVAYEGGGSDPSYIRVYDVNANGTLTTYPLPQYSYESPVGNLYKQIAIEPNGKYMYVVESATGKVVIFDIGTNPNLPAVAGTISDSNINGKPLFGIAMHPAGSRLYVAAKSDPGAIYVYNIGTSKISANFVGAITGDIPYPTYIDVIPDGSKLFVKVLELHSPYRDILVYDTSNNSFITYVRKLPTVGDHQNYTGGTAHNDLDMMNGFEGITISPHGWFFYYGHYHGLSGDGSVTARIKVYGSSVANIKAGVPLIATPAEWEQSGGHKSSDALVSTVKQRVWLAYSAGGKFERTISSMSTPETNTIPTAPRIIYPTAESNVYGYITWEPSVDDTPASNLTYTVQYIWASSLESGSSSWETLAFTPAGKTYTPFSSSFEAGKRYYARVQAYDGRYASAWSYSGPFTMHSDFVAFPIWVSHYMVTSHEAVINWPPVSGATSYIISYKTTSDAVWTNIPVTGVATRDNPEDQNANHRLTGLDQLTSYEVYVRSVRNTVTSGWLDKDRFYTLEGDWLDFYHPSTTKIYVIWGPEVSTNEIRTPLANYYEMQYRLNGGAWTNVPAYLDNSTMDDPLNTTSNFLFDNLTPNSVYDVKVRSRDFGGGYSDWSAIKTFHSLRAPWWIDIKNLSTNEATAYWDRTPTTVEAALYYELSYGTDEAATSETAVPIIVNSPIGTSEYKLTGLASQQAYYVKVRAVYNGGNISDWSPIKTFFTDPFQVGPQWVSHYSVTSHEAIISWDEVETATSYVIEYKPMTSGVWSQVVVTGAATMENPDDPNPNHRITGLSQATSYEVRVRASKIVGVPIYSNWSTENYLFTVERPWVDYYKPGDTSVYLTWGPEVSTSDVTIPLATKYEMRFRLNGGVWNDYTATTLDNNTKDDTTSVNLNFLYGGLSSGATYEVQMRTYYSAGKVSEWSDSKIFHTIRAPWWLDFRNITEEGVSVFWDNAPYTVSGATHYELSYGTDDAATNETPVPIIVNTPAGTSELPIGGLTPFTTYYAKVRAVYSGGVYSDWTPIKSFVTDPFLVGPIWISHYLVTSHEAVIDWGAVPTATSYIISYKQTTEANWTTIEVTGAATRDVATDPNPNHRLTGLTQLVSYEVIVRAKKVIGPTTYYSNWAPRNLFYTLERPWEGFYNPSANAVYIMWGPEVSTNEINVPLANHYDMQYRTNSGGGWTAWAMSSENLTPTSHDDTTNLKLNILYDGLTPGLTYEVRLRTVDNKGGYSDWSYSLDDSTGGGGLPPVGSAGSIFHTYRAPWWINARDITTEEATLYWDDFPRTAEAAIRYEVSYGTDEAATNSTPAVISVTGTNEYKATGLISNETYYAKVRAVFATGTSDWSPIKSFFTSAFLNGPSWVGHYGVTSHEAVIDWDDVPGATSYIIGYKPTSEANWTTIEVTGSATRDVPADPNPNHRLTGLSQLVSYEVRVKAVDRSVVPTLESNWSPIDGFFNLERPWLDFYKPSLTSVYLTWGPEVSTKEIAVPLATQYQMQFRINGGSWSDYIVKTLNNSTKDDPDNAKLSLYFDLLTPNSTYEVRMRSYNSPGKVSDWSAVATFHTLRAPWWIDVRDMNTITGTADAFWEDTPGALSYQFSYGTDASAESLGLTGGIATNETTMTGLIPYTIYYIKARAVQPGGISDWTPIKSFYFMERPDWVSHYNVGLTDAYLTWEGVATAGSTYEISYGTDINATNVGKIAAGTAVDWHLIPLISHTRYYVKVRSYDITGHISMWSAIDTFYTLPAPLNLTHRNVTDTSALMTWEAVTSAVSYELSYGTNEAADDIAMVKNLTGIWTTLTPLTTGWTYNVKVRAYDSVNGYSDWSNIDSFLASINPAITSIDLATGYQGITVNISGSNFGTQTGTVEFNGVRSAPASWSDTDIRVIVPQGATTGNVNVITKTGKTATGSPVFTVVTGRYVLDDMEGGIYHYPFGYGITYETEWYGDRHEGVAALRERYSYNGIQWGGGWGGIMPTCESVPSPEVDLSGYQVITFWIKGDGTNNLATFELTESLKASIGNDPVAASSEVWKYTVPIPLTDMAWHQVSVTLNPSMFVRDARWHLGNNILDLNSIHGYQVIYQTKNLTTTYKYIDYIEAGPMVFADSKSFVMHNVANGNINWVSVPFSNSGILTTTDLANSIGNIIPVGNRNPWVDYIEVNAWDPVTQSQHPYQVWWNGVAWDDLGDVGAVSVGAMYKVAVPAQADGLTWTVSGDVPTSGAVEFTLKSVANGNVNWISVPANSSGISTTTDLAGSIGAAIGSPVAWSDFIEIYLWDPITQSQRLYQLWWDGSVWNDLGDVTPVQISSPYVVTVPVSGNNIIWP